MLSRGILLKVKAVELMEGGGFKVKRPFPGQIPDRLVDPFLLIDEMGPSDYAPGEAVGAPDHPHRGFETVTYMLEGVFEHRDSAGHSGTLKAGDVQWMTAGSGVVHSEMPAASIVKRGGRVHGFQIWVNLPASKKMMDPRYQDIDNDDIPTATSQDKLVSVKVIAGQAMGVNAVIDTQISIIYQHWIVNPGGKFRQPLQSNLNAMLYLFQGDDLLIDGAQLKESELVIFHQGDYIEFSLPEAAQRHVEFIVLAGEPIREPVVRSGPFVMNTLSEIKQAIDDYQQGKMGVINN
ncbi:MAG: pirin family protein [Kangiellaceae bacterium]|nr:pirin family protein [Kangiellaceae bacterium]